MEEPSQFIDLFNLSFSPAHLKHLMNIYQEPGIILYKVGIFSG